MRNPTKVVFLEILDLLAVVGRQGADLICVSNQDYVVSRKADFGVDFVLENQTRGKTDHVGLGQAKLLHEAGDAEALMAVLIARLDQVHFQGDFLDALQQLLLACIPLLELLEDLDLTDAIECVLPPGLMQAARGIDNVVSTVLSQCLDAAGVVLIHEFAEVLVDNVLVDRKFVLRQIEDFLEHASRQVCTVEELQIEVKVRRDEPLLFFHLILCTLLDLILVAVAEALSETFLELGALRDLVQELIAFVELAETESSQTALDEGPIVEHLVADLLLDDQMGDTRLHHNHLGLFQPVMQGVVVDMEEHGFDF